MTRKRRKTRSRQWKKRHADRRGMLCARRIYALASWLRDRDNFYGPSIVDMLRRDGLAPK